MEIQSLAGGQSANEDRMEMYFEIDRPIDGVEAIQRMDPNLAVQVDQNGFTSTIPKSSIPAIAETLVKAGMKIYGISERRTTLEDKFLKVTRRVTNHADGFARSK
ncbi:hypothetical protein PCURB6_10730 [Paenibacillus curdlanolyticus]|nr:hypothetical protein PCURB6_10730 [Paenibacillus curdlanolyticus]